MLIDLLVFELSVERELCAAHAIRIAGAIEPVHGHNFRITLTVSADALDSDGLVVDFHELERVLDSVLEPWKNTNLNDALAFQRLNPSAEHIAQVIADQVQAALSKRGARAEVAACRVTEAPGCSVVYRPGPGRGQDERKRGR